MQVVYLLGRHIKSDGTQVHFWVRLDAWQHEKEAYEGVAVVVKVASLSPIFNWKAISVPMLCSCCSFFLQLVCHFWLEQWTYTYVRTYVCECVCMCVFHFPNNKERKTKYSNSQCLKVTKKCCKNSNVCQMILIQSFLNTVKLWKMGCCCCRVPIFGIVISYFFFLAAVVLSLLLLLVVMAITEKRE